MNHSFNHSLFRSFQRARRAAPPRRAPVAPPGAPGTPHSPPSPLPTHATPLIEQSDPLARLVWAEPLWVYFVEPLRRKAPAFRSLLLRCLSPSLRSAGRVAERIVSQLGQVRVRNVSSVRQAALQSRA
jgi:hypothetical protein